MTGIFKNSRIQSPDNHQKNQIEQRDVKTRIKARQEKAYIGKINGKDFQMSKDQKILSLLKENDQNDQTELLRADHLELPEAIKESENYTELNKQGSAVCDLGEEYKGLYLVKNKLNQGGAESAKLYANYKGEMRALAFENNQVYVLGKDAKGNAEKILLGIPLEDGKINPGKLTDIAKKIQTVGKERGEELTKQVQTGRKFVEQIEALKELDVVEVPKATPAPTEANVTKIEEALRKRSDNQFPEYTALLTNLHLIGENFKKTFDKKSAKDFQTLAEKLLQPEPNLPEPNLEEVTKAKEQFVQSFESKGNLNQAFLSPLKQSFHTYANAIYRDRIATLPAMKEGAEGALPQDYIRSLKLLLQAITENDKGKTSDLSNVFQEASHAYIDRHQKGGTITKAYQDWAAVAANVRELVKAPDISGKTDLFIKLFKSLQTALANPLAPAPKKPAGLQRQASVAELPDEAIPTKNNASPK